MLNPGLSTSLYLKENNFLNSIQSEEVESHHESTAETVPMFTAASSFFWELPL